MKTVAPHDRPREKLQRLGAAALGDNELLAIVLGHGRARASALDLANAVLGASGGRPRAGARRATTSCARSPGIGAARAAQILAAIELGRRTLDARAARDARANRDARAASPSFCCRSTATARSSSSACCCSTRSIACCGRSCSRSARSTPASSIRARCFGEAAAAGAAAMVLFHNHPSGDPKPSQDDVELTRRLAAAGVLMGIDVIDHVILADVRYYSFKERGTTF